MEQVPEGEPGDSKEVNMVPVVDYRFGNKELITSFITPKNPDVQDIVKAIGDLQGDDFVWAVSKYIRDNYQYPLVGETPSCDGQILRYTEGLLKHKWKCCRYYVWAFPSETAQSFYGFCAETGNLAESILVNKVDAWAVLGDVLSVKDDSLVGRHMWCEVPLRDNTFILETTIHDKDAGNMVSATSAYGKDSDWAIQGGIYYSAKALFSDKKYKGDDQFAATMDIPAKRLLLFGLDETRKVKEKQLAKEWRAEQKIKENLIRIAYGGRK